MPEMPVILAEESPHGAVEAIAPQIDAGLYSKPVDAPHVAEMQFAAASIVPASANSKDRTVDVTWYTGVSVPRVNQRTEEPYMLRLDMSGARLGRLNSGAPVFDNHQSGSGMSAMISGVAGTRAQIGVVRKAWADGTAGKATLQFASGDPISDSIWNKVQSGIIQNLSFGTWIYAMEPDKNATTPLDEESASGPQNFVATDWEPFEISPVCIPADFNTAFLAAEVATPPQIVEPQVLAEQVPAVTSEPTAVAEVFEPMPKGAVETTPVSEPETMRAPARKEQQPVMENTLQDTGVEARQELSAKPAPAVNTEAFKQEGIKEGQRLERERVQSIRLAASKFASQLDETFVSALIEEGLSLQESYPRILEKLEVKSNLDTNGKKVAIDGVVAITRDESDSRRESMEAALLVRHDPRGYAQLAPKGRDYMGASLMDMAKECLEAVGVKTRGLTKTKLAALALNGRYAGEEHFSGAYASTSDFPKVLENVANKSLRMAYETYPATFKPFCRMVTASDFKPVNRVQLSDVSALKSLNENGEYKRTTPTDSKETYSLVTFGEIVAISRQTVINDDLQAFTRIPMLLGVAAARLEADTVWGVITANAAMSDTVALFHASHSNLNSGAGSALGTSGLAAARTAMRLQKAPQGTLLNLTPSYLLAPAALEQTAEQLVSPINIASSDFTKVVPQWIRSLQVIVEPRLDAASTTAWYLVSNPANIDTIEYCYLEGQEGVYTETRQGFDVDGMEIKVRLDFQAAAVEYRGLQQNAGA